MKDCFNITIENTGIEEENIKAYSKALQIIISRLSEVMSNEQGSNICEGVDGGAS